MRRQRLSRLHLLLIAPLTLLTFSARLTWTQERPSASKPSTQSSNLAAQFVAIPEAEIRFRPAYENLALPLALSHAPMPSLARFRPGDFGYRPSLIRNNAVSELSQLAKIPESQANANHFIVNPPTEWLADFTTQNRVHFRTPDPGADMAYYGHRIPWAGRAILSIGEKAEVHPRVFRVLEVVRPGLTFENRVPRGSASNIHLIGRGQLP